MFFSLPSNEFKELHPSKISLLKVDFDRRKSFYIKKLRCLAAVKDIREQINPDESGRDRGARFCRRSDSGASQRQAVPAWGGECTAGQSHASRPSNRPDSRTDFLSRGILDKLANGGSPRGARLRPCRVTIEMEFAGGKPRGRTGRSSRPVARVTMVDRRGPIRTGGTQ